MQSSQFRRNMAKPKKQLSVSHRRSMYKHVQTYSSCEPCVHHSISTFHGKSMAFLCFRNLNWQRKVIPGSFFVMPDRKPIATKWHSPCVSNGKDDCGYRCMTSLSVSAACRQGTTLWRWGYCIKNRLPTAWNKQQTTIVAEDEKSIASISSSLEAKPSALVVAMT